MSNLACSTLQEVRDLWGISVVDVVQFSSQAKRLQLTFKYPYKTQRFSITNSYWQKLLFQWKVERFWKKNYWDYVLILFFYPALFSLRPKGQRIFCKNIYLMWSFSVLLTEKSPKCVDAMWNEPLSQLLFPQWCLFFDLLMKL